MKWIGQHIWSFISRFRSDVYLESPTAGGSDPDKFLGIDSNNKIIYRTGVQVLSDIGGGDGDITGVTITTDSGGGSAASDTAGSADFSILGNNGVGVTNSGTTITAVAVPGEIDHDSLNNFASNEHFTQANITTVGTIDTGVWNGDVIASAYLDSDTAHYSLSRQFTHHMMTDNIGVDTKVYIALQETDAESSSGTNKNLPFLVPGAGKLLKVLCRVGSAVSDLSDHTFTWTLETTNTSNNTGAAPSVVGTKTGPGPTGQTMIAYDFTSASGSNEVNVGDTVMLGISADDTTGNFKWYVTCVWEFDLS